MLTVVVFGLGLLGAFELESPPDDRGVGAPAVAESKLEPAEALSKYNEMREKTPDTAAAQWKLANWCEQNHLDAEAFVHYTAVVMRDPSREAAWRKLGYKKHHGRWMTDEQIAGEAEQARADKEWGLRLKKVHREIHGGPRQAEAWTAVGEIVDPRAIPAVYREFGFGGASDQVIAIQIFGQIDAPLSSKVLAVLAVYGKTSDVRRRATESLRGRNPDEYLPLLVNLLADPLKYEVRPVGGPGSPGVLYVEGERFNVRRFYAAPAPFVKFQPGDIVSYDENGLPAIVRPFAMVSSTLIQETGTKKTGTTKTYANTEAATRFSMSEMMVEAQRGAMAAQMQLQGDIAQIDRLNDAKKQFNELVMNVAKDASGKDLGKEPKDWRDALAGRRGYRKDEKKTPRKPTIDELVPLAYLPRFGELTFARTTSTSTTPPDT